MRSKIRFSAFSIVLTIIIFLVFYLGCIFTVHDKLKFFILLSLYIILFGAALFFCPAYIETDNHSIILGSLLKRKNLSIKEIERIELFQPTMGAKRICGSGGFLGYWGIFSENDIGKYYAFFGKSSDCFLIIMRNGKKYVVGCDHPAEMVEYINSRIMPVSGKSQPIRHLP